jgi:UDP-glucose 4-epimerase
VWWYFLRVLVTGGAGFIGSHVIGALQRAGHGVLVVDNLSTGRKENVPGRIQLVVKDICDPDLFEVFAEHAVDTVVHLAAQISVARSIVSPVADIATNLLGTVNVLTAAQRAGVRRILFSSSAAIYGNPAELPIREDAPKLPLSPYGLSKLTGEAYVRMLATHYGLSHAILRFSNVYGPGQMPEGEAGVVAIFCHHVLQGQVPTIYGDGGQTRDLVYVGDVAEAVRLAAESVQHVGTWNVGTGRALSIRNLWQEVWIAAHAVGLSPNAALLEPEYGPGRPGDIRDSYLAVDQIQQALGWVAKTDLAEGLRLTLQLPLSRLGDKAV